jgi:hypothetical protein
MVWTPSFAALAKPRTSNQRCKGICSIAFSAFSLLVFIGIYNTSLAADNECDFTKH